MVKEASELIDFSEELGQEPLERKSVELSKNLYEQPTDRVTGQQGGEEEELFRYDFTLREMVWPKSTKGVVVKLSIWTEDGRMVASIGLTAAAWKEKDCSQIFSCEPATLKEELKNGEYVLTLLSETRLKNVVVCVGSKSTIEGGGGWFQTYNVDDYKTLQGVEGTTSYVLTVASSSIPKAEQPIGSDVANSFGQILPPLQCGKCLEFLYCQPEMTTVFTCTHCNTYNNTVEPCSILQTGFGLFFGGLLLFVVTLVFFIVGLLFGFGVLVYGWLIVAAIFMGRGCFYCYAASCVVQAISQESICDENF